MKFKVKIRKTGKFEGMVRPSAVQIDGKIYNFELGYFLDESDHSLYGGEIAMFPRDSSYPGDAPNWIASGDLKQFYKKSTRNAEKT